mmetsp:Transcript_122016/g.345834  ORF Transcript_122016/g.345834 Transcript_122016/m.345834 type:complete len:545 (-) Transcript_122016:518-2152(-)
MGVQLHHRPERGHHVAARQEAGGEPLRRGPEDRGPGRHVRGREDADADAGVVRLRVLPGPGARQAAADLGAGDDGRLLGPHGGPDAEPERGGLQRLEPGRQGEDPEGDQRPRGGDRLHGPLARGRQATDRSGDAADGPGQRAEFSVQRGQRHGGPHPGARGDAVRVPVADVHGDRRPVVRHADVPGDVQEDRGPHPAARAGAARAGGVAHPDPAEAAGGEPVAHARPGQPRTHRGDPEVARAVRPLHAQLDHRVDHLPVRRQGREHVAAPRHVQALRREHRQEHADAHLRRDRAGEQPPAEVAARRREAAALLRRVHVRGHPPLPGVRLAVVAAASHQVPAERLHARVRRVHPADGRRGRQLQRGDLQERGRVGDGARARLGQQGGVSPRAPVGGKPRVGAAGGRGLRDGPLLRHPPPHHQDHALPQPVLRRAEQPGAGPEEGGRRVPGAGRLPHVRATLAAERPLRRPGGRAGAEAGAAGPRQAPQRGAGPPRLPGGRVPGLLREARGGDARHQRAQRPQLEREVHAGVPGPFLRDEQGERPV